MIYDKSKTAQENSWNLTAVCAQDRIDADDHLGSDHGIVWAVERIKTLEAEAREKDKKIAELRTTAEAGQALAKEVSKLQREIARDCS